MPRGTATAVASGMAFLAGSVDVCGLARLKDRFVSFMSGNTTTMGAALGVADLGRARSLAALIALFVVGAAAGAVVAERTRRPPTAITLGVAALLALPLLLPGTAAVAFVLAMGALNAALGRAGDTAVGMTYVTGALVHVGQGAGAWVAGRRDSTAWLLHGRMWLSFFAGAVAAGAMQARLGRDTIWPLPLLALALVGATAFLPPAEAR